jgi:heptosyltransferase-2
MMSIPKIKLGVRRFCLLTLSRLLELCLHSHAAPWRSDSRLKDLKNIVVFRLDAIGDNIMNTAFLRELRRNLPSARITLVVSGCAYNMMEKCPYVDRVLCYQEPVYRHGWHVLLTLVRALQFSRKHFWADLPDAAVSPRWDFYTPTMLYLLVASRARYRLGTAEDSSPGKRVLNRGVNRRLSFAFAEDGVKHEVERNLDFLRALGADIASEKLELWLTSEDEDWADNFIAATGLPADLALIAVCPGASLPQKEWPIECYIEVCRRLVKEFNAGFVIIGGPQDISVAEVFSAAFSGRCVQAAGVSSLRQTACLLKRTRLYFGNDTGPMHMAAAVGRPIVVVTPHPENADSKQINSPHRFGPWGVDAVILRPETGRSPCQSRCVSAESHCIKNVSVTDAYGAVGRMVQKFTTDNQK